MDKKITLYDYLLWTADGDENEIDSYYVADQIGLWQIGIEDDKHEIEAFYNKYKNCELKNFTETYNNPDGTYHGLGHFDTVITFSIDGMNFEIEDVNGSYLHDLADSKQEETLMSDSKQEETLLSDKKMVEWAGKLKEQYNSAESNSDLVDCADEMADFIDAFLKVYNKK